MQRSVKVEKEDSYRTCELTRTVKFVGDIICLSSFIL